MRLKTRVDPVFMQDQFNRRKILNDSPGQSGGLPELKSRVELIEIILAIHKSGASPMVVQSDLIYDPTGECDV
jgi:hypothetical protein